MTHTIVAEIPVPFRFPGMPEDEREVAHPKVEVEYTYVKGVAPIISHLDGGDPGWPAEVDLVCAKLIDGDGLAPTETQIREWAEEWLDDEGYVLACMEAEGQR